MWWINTSDERKSMNSKQKRIGNEETYLKRLLKNNEGILTRDKKIQLRKINILEATSIKWGKETTPN